MTTLERVFPYQGTDQEVINQIADTHPEMDEYLVGAEFSTPEELANVTKEPTFGSVRHPNRTPEELIEFNRTAMSIILLRQAVEGDYTGFVTGQPREKALTIRSFRQLQEYTFEVLPDTQAVQSMVDALVIHDAGKSKKLLQLLPEGQNHADHDEVFQRVLNDSDEATIARYLPSFLRLPPKYQDMLKNSHWSFNLGQYIQGESPAASLVPLKKQSPEVLAFHINEALWDVAGARGHITQKGSLFFTESNYRTFQAGIDSLSLLAGRVPLAEVYQYYLQKRAQMLNLPCNNLTEIAVTRLCALNRVNTPEEAERFVNEYNTVPQNIRNRIEIEMNITGLEGIPAILLGYAPALLVNVEKNTQDLSPGARMLQKMAWLADSFANIRAVLEGGVFTVDIRDLASRVSKDPFALRSSEIKVIKTGNTAIASLD